MFTIIGLYTKNTEYENIIKDNLIASLKKFDIPYKIYEMPSLGSWVKNTNLKSVVLEKAIEEINTDILMLDADCTVNEYPSLFNEIPEEYDCAFHYLNAEKWYNKEFYDEDRQRHDLGGLP